MSKYYSHKPSKFHIIAEKRTAQLTLVNEVGRLATSILDLNEMMRQVTRAIQRDFNYYNVALFLVDESHHEAVMQTVVGGFEGIAPQSYRQSVDEGIIGWVVRTGQSRLVNDVSKDPYYVKVFLGEVLTRSELCVPIKLDNKIIGALDVQSIELNAFDQVDVTALEALAAQIAAAIRNARLLVSSTLDLNSVLRLILEQLKRVLVYDTASILLFSEKGPAMIALAGYDDQDRVIKEAPVRLKDSPIYREMAITKRPLVIPDVRHDDRWIWVSGAEHVRSWIGVPLLARDKMIGVLSLDSRQPGFYTPEDAELAQFLANQAAIAIENARLFEAEARRRQEAETLRLAAQALSATLDLQQVFELILAQLREVVPYDSASVQLLRGDRLEIIGGLGFPNLDELLGESFPVDGNNPNHQVMSTRAPFIVDDAPNVYESFRKEPHARAHIRSWLGVPLLFGDRLIGMIALDKREPSFYTAEHARLALAFAAQAAIAIENARLYGELQTRMRELQSILDHAPLAIALLDTELRYLLVNKFAEEKEGYTLSEIKGKRCHEVRQQAQPCSECAALLSLRTGEVHRWEGELYPGYIIEETCVPIKDEQDHLQGILSIRQDVTERRRLQTQLLQSERLSAVGQLVSGVAHELNNPLTSIMGYAELVQRDTDVSEITKADLRKIYEQAERSAHIVRKLLTFARQYAPAWEKTDINSTIEKTLDLLTYQLEVDNIHVIHDLDPSLPYTQADVHQLQQVFLNIINNAHQAMKKAHGRGTLTVRTRTMGEGKTILISFTDDGPGIPPNIINRIFDPFFTTKDVGEGTGLGLSICYGIVTEHGGRIWAESEPGRGATFFVELPVVKSREEVRPQSGETGTLIHPRIPARRILIVEDELVIAGLLSRILNLEGHTTDLATDGEQALARIRQMHYDAVICDLKMPGLNGQELYRRLTEMKSPLAEAMIFTTGDLANPETQAFLTETGRPCLRKPFLQEDVLAILGKVFGDVRRNT
ncbi:MAG: GAF domain-containing protein [Anaerolineae bacterium]|nr:GAF domain-containing protein [Anaerolineae bacterium]